MENWRVMCVLCVCCLCVSWGPRGGSPGGRGSLTAELSTVINNTHPTRRYGRIQTMNGYEYDNTNKWLYPDPEAMDKAIQEAGGAWVDLSEPRSAGSARRLVREIRRGHKTSWRPYLERTQLRASGAGRNDGTHIIRGRSTLNPDGVIRN